jgi:hypothetical protein
MTLSDLAALGSFVSGAAVTVTLVFLLIQTRQTNRNQRAMMQQGRSAQQVDLLLRCADEKLSAARLKSVACDPAMTEQEIDTATYVWLAIWRSLEDGFLQYKGGTLGSESFQSDTAILRFLSHIRRCAPHGGWSEKDMRPHFANSWTGSCAKPEPPSQRPKRTCGAASSGKSWQRLRPSGGWR